MTIIHDVIKFIAGKVTSTDFGCRQSCFKSKNRKVITDRDFCNKKSDTEISKVKLTDNKEV